MAKDVKHNTIKQLKAYYDNSLICDLEIRKNVVLDNRYYTGNPFIKLESFYPQTENNSIYEMKDTVWFAENYGNKSMYLYTKDVGYYTESLVTKLKPDKNGYISFVPQSFDVLRNKCNKPIGLFLNKKKE